MHKQSLANARKKLPQAPNSAGVFSLRGLGYLPPSEAEKYIFLFYLTKLNSNILPNVSKRKNNYLSKTWTKFEFYKFK